MKENKKELNKKEVEKISGGEGTPNKRRSRISIKDYLKVNKPFPIMGYGGPRINGPFRFLDRDDDFIMHLNEKKAEDAQITSKPELKKDNLPKE